MPNITLGCSSNSVASSARAGIVPCSLLSTDEAAPWLLRSVLGPSLKVRHWSAVACPEKDNEADEVPGEHILWEAAVGTGVV